VTPVLRTFRNRCRPARLSADAVRNQVPRVRPLGAIENPLLRLPKVGDNADMQTDPPNSDPPKRKPRRFRFSLRSLMIVVTLLAVPLGYVGWQAKIVRERREFLASTGRWCEITIWKTDAKKRPALPRVRLWLGDQPVRRIGLPLTTEKTERESIAAMFAEAEVLACPAHGNGPGLIANPNGGINVITDPLIPFPDETPFGSPRNDD
jgi:hypothetical protein